MTLLTICQDAAEEVGFSSPVTIINNIDPIAKQLLRFANKEGHILSQEWPPWNKLIKEGTITLVTSDQDYALPSDFRYILPNTTWNRDNTREVINPISSQEWQFLKAWSSSLGLNLKARIRNNEMEFEQDITASENGETIKFEYVSDQWCEDSGGTGQTSFLADADVSRLNEELMTQGVVWRLRKAKGLDWQSDFQVYTDLKKKLLGRDLGARTLDLSGSRHFIDVNLPEGDFTL